jgi:protein-tyrosine phosphatase
MQKAEIKDFSCLITDIHSHIIPFLDDGSSGVAESMEIINEMYYLGYRKIIATPHVMVENYENTPELINANLLILRKALSEGHINVDVFAAAEYYTDYNFLDILKMKNVLTFGNNFLLFELPLTSPFLNIKELIFNIRTSGYIPVLAHPERYSYWHGDFSNYTDLINREVLFQVNINSFHSKNPYKKMAEKLAANNLISFLGSDTHSIRNIDFLKESLFNKNLVKLLMSGKILNNTL